MKTLTLQPIDHVEGAVQLPGSKSISNRVLLLAALAEGTTRVGNLLDSDDTRFMLDALIDLGVDIRRRDGAADIVGRGGPLVTADVERELYLGMAGTAYRPLTATLCLGRGTFRLMGSERMAERPIADLVDGLRALGASIDYLGRDGFPPLRVRGTGLRGGSIRMRGDVSSQFLTSLLMAAPYATRPVTVTIDGEQVSKPYLDITIGLMRRFGVAATHDEYRRFDVPTGRYRSPGTVHVEGDASGATYFLAAGAIRGGLVVHGIGRTSAQGDVAFVDVLTAMGAAVRVADDSVEVRAAPLHGVDLDLNAIPDAAMTVAVLALFARGTTHIRNIGNWRIKETDRLSAMANELRKLGATVDEGTDSIAVTPPRQFVPARIETYGDHRIAMCFSLAALGGVPVTIVDPDCVAKTFPEYFAVFESISRRG
ncbi:MAG TPA: 3-phosphoshikimate 1-carboxyvinyltransferase [Pseudomonadales bacterium]|nr:3-phosphoshikimate 1-carboxyvinyltransferase [Pseudomonadales bacterium]